MKTIQLKNLIFLSSVVSLFLFFGFSCGSPEMEGAKLALKQNNYTRAEELLVKETTTNPKNEDAWFILGKVRIEMKNIKGMVEAFNSAKSAGNVHEKEIAILLTHTWATLVNQGVAFMDSARKVSADSAIGLNRSALSSFQMALVVNPDSIITYRNLAGVYFSLKNRDSALIALNTAYSKQKSITLATEIAQEHYNEAIRLRDASQPAQAKQEFALAVKTLDETKTWNEKNSDPTIQKEIDEILLGSYIELGDTVTALKSYVEALKNDPTNVDKIYNYGFYLMRSGKLSEALTQFESILKIDAKNEYALFACGEAYYRLGQTQSAEAIKTLKESHNKEAALDTTFKANIRKAVNFFEQCVAVNPENSGAWINLGNSYALINDKRAKSAFDKAESLKK